VPPLENEGRSKILVAPASRFPFRVKETSDGDRSTCSGGPPPGLLARNRGVFASSAVCVQGGPENPKTRSFTKGDTLETLKRAAGPRISFHLSLVGLVSEKSAPKVYGPLIFDPSHRPLDHDTKPRRLPAGARDCRGLSACEFRRPSLHRKGPESGLKNFRLAPPIVQTAN
jgi:hypothetical protein